MSAAPQPFRRSCRLRRCGALLHLLALALLLTWPAAQAGAQGQDRSRMTQAEAVIGGETFRLAVAETPGQQELGLGGTTRLGPNEGMLFVYPDRLRPAFWMRRMRISIDIIFLDNQRVVSIAHSVPPPAPGTPLDALATYRPPEPVNLVLEVAAGRARELGLEPGDHIRLRFGVR